MDGVRWPNASEPAELHSQALGVPPERHVEIRRSREVDGERVPFDLLTFIAERGDWPWLGRARTCTGPWKTKMVYQAFTLHRSQTGVGGPDAVGDTGLAGSVHRDQAGHKSVLPAGQVDDNAVPGRGELDRVGVQGVGVRHGSGSENLRDHALGAALDGAIRRWQQQVRADGVDFPPG
ncbi:hypothetical protein OHU34_43710 (plasmid) [Streptomyces sp. NBC_00080]|uniref:hypothetical protein n=1 Tax=Streptomyces sp. NBC_00080 TaxID=2975645 RepID=UPI002F90E122